MLDNLITEFYIEDRHEQTGRDPDRPELDGDKVLTNIDKNHKESNQSYTTAIKRLKIVEWISHNVLLLEKKT